jgi:hypothetical protein
MGKSLERLARMRPRELQRIHEEMFGSVPSFNSEQLRRRIAFRLQTDREGGLPASAKQHALAIAREAGSRIRVPATATISGPVPHSTVTGLVSDHDPRVPMPGSVIVKEHRGHRIVVHVFESGLEYDGRRFASLSEIEREITGTKWNVFLFFGLERRKARGR